jgi:peptidoglycan hydrolase-like protein with peptidoglycan-binding domain
MKLVMRVQLALNGRGYCNCTVDGKLGKTTIDAIKKFQKANGLAETGLLDEKLLSLLGISL